MREGAKLDPMLQTGKLRQHALFIYGEVDGSLHCEMRSSTEPKYYRIRIRGEDGACACECPYFQHLCKQAVPTIYSGRVCKHIRDFREFLQLELRDLATDQTIED